MKKLILATIILTGVILMTSCGRNNDGNGNGDGRIAALPFEPIMNAEQGPGQTNAPMPGDPIAVIKTTMGDISLRLFPEHAPLAVENFSTHARNGFYDGIIFHRVMNNFMIQTGCPLGMGTGGESIWGHNFEDEVAHELNHLRGALSMANRGPVTNGSQFFIVQNPGLDPTQRNAFQNALENPEIVTDFYPIEHVEFYLENGGTPHLDTPGFGSPNVHTVFGMVFSGMNVVDAIAAVPTGAADRPVDEISIITIEITEYAGNE